jgi:quercetin dioxygenase-like cupin family protein
MEGSGQMDRVARYQEHADRGLFDRIDGQRTFANKRVLRASEREWQNNIQPLIDASNGFDDRAVACFLRRIPPGGKSDIHRHNFEAMGYIVKGRGYEIHDGEKLEWAEGDAVFIPANVWHQHINSDPDNEAIVLLITNWPLLLHLGICTLEPAPTWEDAMSRPSAIPAPRLPKEAPAT